MNNNLSILTGRDRVNALKLSKEAGTSRTTIYGLYHERTKSSDVQTVMKLCGYFEITPDESFGIKEKKEA